MHFIRPVRFLASLVLSGFLGLASMAAIGAVPQTLNYQGFLSNKSTGAPLSATVSVTFRLFDAAASGSLLYTEVQPAVVVSNGVFNTQIGAVTPLALAFDKPYWLELTVGGDTLAPRQPLASSATALRAATADTATTAVTVTGAVPAAQVTGTLSNATVPGAAPWVAAVTASQTAASNTGYVSNSASTTAFTLPANPALGDVVKFTSPGAGGFTVLPNAGQTIAAAGVARESNRNWGGVASSSDGTKLVAVVTGGQIYTSVDSGVTWTARDSSRSWNSVASSADGTKLVAVVDGGQIYTSADSGVTWTARDSSRGWRVVASSADGTKLVAAVTNAQIYTSTDSGITWTARESGRNWSSVASSADGTKLVALVYAGQIYTSTDSGLTWTSRESNRAWQAVASSADGTKLIASTNNGSGGLLRTSVDSGVTWTVRESSRPWFPVSISADGTKLVAGVYGGQIYVSVDGGANWAARDSTKNWNSIASSIDGNKLIAGPNGGQLYTYSSTITGVQYSSVELLYGGNGFWTVSNEQGLNGRVAASDVTATGNVTMASANVNGNLTVSNPGVLNFGTTARQMITLYDDPGAKLGFGVQNVTLYSRLDPSTGQGGFAWFRGGAHTDGIVDPGPGGTTLMQLDRSGNLFIPGTYSPSSDRNAKQDFSDIDPLGVLDAVITLPISRWAYKTAPGVRHIGPMAQDFYARFGVGGDDKHIATVDADGVALAAIQGLNRKLEAVVKAQADKIAGLEKAQAEKIAGLERQVAEFRQQAAEVAELRRTVKALLARMPPLRAVAVAP